MIVVHNTNNTKVYTPKQKKQADWIIDNIFNNGSKYEYNNILQGIKFTHYDDTFSWDLDRKQTLVFCGKIKTITGQGCSIKFD